MSVRHPEPSATLANVRPALVALAAEDAFQALGDKVAGLPITAAGARASTPGEAASPPRSSSPFRGGPAAVLLTVLCIAALAAPAFVGWRVPGDVQALDRVTRDAALIEEVKELRPAIARPQDVPELVREHGDLIAEAVRDEPTPAEERPAAGPMNGIAAPIVATETSVAFAIPDPAPRSDLKPLRATPPEAQALSESPEDAGPPRSTPPDAAEGRHERLLARARAMLQLGDVSGARLVLGLLVKEGSGEAAFLLAESYDPHAQADWQPRPVDADDGKALELYRLAQARGIGRAAERIASGR